MSDVWKKLSAIDCSKHVEKKGNLSYLSWTWAWSVLMEHYPSSSYIFHNETQLENGSIMVSCTVTVEGQSHTMWLPVMDNRNNSITNPDTRKISDARMRCLVKAIAMHGLGIYIYAGEDLPEAVVDAKKDTELKSDIAYQELVEKWLDSLVCVREALAANDYSTAKEALNEIDRDALVVLWKAPSKGGWFTTEERAKMKSNEWANAV